MKKGIYWLNLLPDEVKEKWLINYEKYIDKDESLLESESIFFNFINGSFHWLQTPEGDEYWDDIARKDINELIQESRNDKLNKLGIV